MDKNTINIEQLVEGVPQVREHKLKLDYTCGCNPCDCYLIPQERDFCSPDCNCYDSTKAKDIAKGYCCTKK